MRQAEQAIVLRSVPYSESSLVLDLLCERSGRLALMWKGGKKKKGAASLVFPLNLVEVEHSPPKYGSMGLLHSLSCPRPLLSLRTRPARMAMAMFCTEVFLALLPQDGGGQELFELAKAHGLDIDTSDRVEDCLPMFLTNMVEDMGLTPRALDNLGEFFDLREGVLTSRIPDHPDHIQGAQVSAAVSLLEEPIPMQEKVLWSGDLRRQVVDLWLKYLWVQCDVKKELKSLQVLDEVFGL